MHKYGCTCGAEELRNLRHNSRHLWLWLTSINHEIAKNGKFSWFCHIFFGCPIWTLRGCVSSNSRLWDDDTQTRINSENTFFRAQDLKMWLKRCLMYIHPIFFSDIKDPNLCVIRSCIWITVKCGSIGLHDVTMAPEIICERSADPGCLNLCGDMW